MEGSKVLSSEQVKMIDEIDMQLDVLMKNMEYDEYLNFLRNNDYLATYDDVLGYNDVNYLPDAFLAGLTVDFLSKVRKIVDDKISEIMGSEQE